jgi:glycosyltransferase involved in cell wall biosynthesis
MRIVQALGSARKGGAERFFIRLVEAFHRRGVEQTVIVRRGHWVQQQLAEAGVATKGVWFGGRFDFLTRRAFTQTLSAARADIVLTWMRRATTACPPGPWAHIARLGNYYKLKPYARCDHLVGITPGITEYIRRAGWPGERVSYIPNFVPEYDALPASRAALNTPADKPLILWLGRMEREKGPDIVIRALSHVPRAYLWMAGSGSYEKEVKALAGEIGVADRVRFLGWRDDIHPLLLAADLYVCASRFEAHGNIVLEAWAHGLPLVSARSPGPEHLIEDRKTGLLVANDDAAAMAAGLNELIAQPGFARNLGEAGREHYHSCYSEVAVTGRYLDLFEELIRRKKGQAAPSPALAEVEEAG